MDCVPLSTVWRQPAFFPNISAPSGASPSSRYRRALPAYAPLEQSPMLSSVSSVQFRLLGWARAFGSPWVEGMTLCMGGSAPSGYGISVLWNVIFDQMNNSTITSLLLKLFLTFLWAVSCTNRCLSTKLYSITVQEETSIYSWIKGLCSRQGAV